jgi:4-hydroxybenzoate polyprenyltransferase
MDLFRERLISTLLIHPETFLKSLLWFLQGGLARCKVELAVHYPLDAATLPYNGALVGLLKKNRQQGARLVLATAAPLSWAEAVARHMGFFDRVLATTLENGNVKGVRKLNLILKDARGESFGYAGDAKADRPIFEAAQLSIVVGAAAALAGRHANEAVVVERRVEGAHPWWKALRPHQWSKNVLVIVPMLAAHQVRALWPAAFVSFVCFCLLASGLYLVNDLYDLRLDRLHPEKRLRSIAAGTLEAATALLLALVLIGIAGLLAVHFSFKFDILMLCYCATSVLYSSQIKKIAIFDLVTLAFLYSIRVFAGGAACGLAVSMWLAAFTFFIALSLAHLKRYVEVHRQSVRGFSNASRPAYSSEDLLLLGVAGIGAGLISVLILALYITSSQVYSLYRFPQLLFVICVLHFYWIERAWMLATRGVMSSDPIVFIVSDRVSFLVGVMVLITIWLAASL